MTEGSPPTASAAGSRLRRELEVWDTFHEREHDPRCRTALLGDYELEQDEGGLDKEP
jgi:hypothetical protein